MRVLTSPIRVLTYAKIMFWVVFAEVVALSYIEVRPVYKQANKMVRSYREIAVDIRRNYTHNEEFQRNVSKAAFGTIAEANQKMAESFDKMYVRFDKTMNNADTLLLTTNSTVQHFDVRFNGELLPSATQLLRTLDGRVAVFFDRDLAGLTGTTANSVEQASADIHELLCNPDIPLIMKEIRVNLENGETITFYAGEVAQDFSETSGFYKNKLTKPSKWDQAKWLINAILYATGEIIAPYGITQKVQIVR